MPRLTRTPRTSHQLVTETVWCQAVVRIVMTSSSTLYWLYSDLSHHITHYVTTHTTLQHITVTSNIPHDNTQHTAVTTHITPHHNTLLLPPTPHHTTTHCAAANTLQPIATSSLTLRLPPRPQDISCVSSTNPLRDH